MRSQGRTLILVLQAATLSLCAALASSCAGRAVVVDGQEMRRLDLEFTGQPYHIRHSGAHPSPGGPSSGVRGSGGEITGLICGMNVNYDVRHAGDHVQLVGFLDGNREAQIAVRDVDGVRVFTGKLSNLGVELRLSSDLLQGHSGLRVFSLSVDGDRLAGAVRLQQWTGPLPAVINGWTAFQRLPAADQAAILPALLTCTLPSTDQGVPAVFTVGFGGAPTAVPQLSSTLYNPYR